MKRKKNVNMEKFMKWYNQGLEDAEIAVKLGVCPATIRYHRNKLGLTPNGARVKPIDIDKFKKMYADGANDAVLAKEFGVSTWRIRVVRHRLGFNAQARKRINYMRMRELYDKGLTDLSISKELSVCSVTVGNWRRENNLPINNEKYKHMIEARRLNNEAFQAYEQSGEFEKAIDEDSLYSNTTFLETLMQRKLKQ